MYAAGGGGGGGGVAGCFTEVCEQDSTWLLLGLNSDLCAKRGRATELQYIV